MGKEIRSVDKGHFNDKTEAVVTMSASRALLSTEIAISRWICDALCRTYYRQPQTSR
jgi:hypothetical protein